MILKDKSLSIGIWSTDHEQLAKWYEEVLGFRVREKCDHPQDTYIDFEFGKNYFFIGGRKDKIAGNNKDPYRMMVGFNVESVTEVYRELLKHKIRFVAKPFEVPTGGFWCMTIQDPEGNILQFFGQK